MIEGLLDQVGQLDPFWFLLLVFFLPFGETVALLDILVPGEIGLLLMGAAAEQVGVPLSVVIAVAACGAFLGDSTSWFIGHRWGTALLLRWEPVRRRVTEPLERAERYFDTYGGPTVFTGRFIGAFRALVPMVAGTSGMSYRSFVPWNVAASIAWVSLVVLLGAAFGEAAASVVDRFGFGVLAVLVVVGAFVFIRRRRSRGRAPKEEASESDG